MAAKRVIVYGGRGALGSKCVQHFKSKGWVSGRKTCALLRRMIVANLFMCSCNDQWVASIDMAASDEANENVIVKMSESFTEQAAQVS